MLKVLLIDADSSWLIRRDDLFDLEQIIPPIGLMYIATYIKHKFKERILVRVVSRRADCMSRGDLETVLKELSPDVVGIRGMNMYKEVFHKTAAAVKQFRKDILVIGGGPYITMDVENAAIDENVDYFVIEEGEVTFFEIIEKILDGQSFFNIKGLAYRKSKKLIRNIPREFIGNLDLIPFPDYNLISIDKYSKYISYGYNRRRQAVMFSSRGCPYECIYCHNIFGKRYRARSAQNVFQEIENLYNNFSIKDFYFVDDNFNLDYQRAMEIFDLIISSGIKINLYLANGIRGDIIDRLFIDKMVEAGVIWVTFSIETASERMQKLIKKFINLEKIAANIHYACAKNIMVNCCVMVGFPAETIDEALQTIDFLKQFKKIIIPMFFSVKYYPNTEIYNLALKYGINIDHMKNAYTEVYHNVRHSETPLIDKKAFRNIYFKFMYEVFLSKERLLNAIEIQKGLLTKGEILDVYSIFFRKRIKDLQKDVLHYAK